jgi:ATP-dependent Clp protease protease subunit
MHLTPLPMTPTQPTPVRRVQALAEDVDTRGHHFVNLPRLDPIDAYYLYNPDNYYRESP